MTRRLLSILMLMLAAPRILGAQTFAASDPLDLTSGVLTCRAELGLQHRFTYGEMRHDRTRSITITFDTTGQPRSMILSTEQQAADSIREEAVIVFWSDSATGMRGHNVSRNGDSTEVHPDSIPRSFLTPQELTRARELADRLWIRRCGRQRR